MKIVNSANIDEIEKLLNNGAVGILRTDTLYGLIARADDEVAVNRIYELKNRDDTKSPIVLIGSFSQLYDEPDNTTKKFTKSVWPGPVSVIIPSRNAPHWIKRENESVAYRMPDKKLLRELVLKTGPLVAPSANPQDLPPATNVSIAQEYFGDLVDFYVDEGEVINQQPSKLMRILDDGAIERLR